MDLIPDAITLDAETNQHMAHFSYSDGIQYAKENNFKQTTSHMDMSNRTHFMVCCGDVILIIDSLDFPNIKRTVI